ncbi:ABC transporter ATP-binding protein [Aquisphaera insulae]|uniref:ABC transporter ATP-binding protein n=1 Tax=Aquisphaera insulae TaxID=2712864 RepID=UPI0013E9E52F|nr:ABC transporter ATP-binding protein [Aquisphaera insulae]
MAQPGSKDADETRDDARGSDALAHALRRLEGEFLRPYRVTLWLCLLGLLAQSALMLPGPLIQGWLLDRLVALGRIAKSGGGGLAFTPAAAGSAYRALAAATAGLVACQVLRSLLSWAVASTTGRVSQEVVVALRSALQRKLMRLPMAYFDSHQTGRIMARVTSDVGGILSFVNSGLLQLLNDLLLGVGIAFLLVWLEWRLALIALVAVPLYALNQALFAARIRRTSQAIRAQVSAIYALLSERVSAVRIVRAYAQEDAEVATLVGRVDRHRELNMRNIRSGAALNALATMISGLGTVAVLGLGVLLVTRGALTVGSLLAFYALIGQLYGPIVRLTQFQATAQATCISVERLFEILDEPEPIADSPSAIALEDRPEGSLRFDGVSFRYGPDWPLVLEEISAAIAPGQTVGIVGASGAGKSTLLAVAARLYDLEPGEGSIALDGRDIRDIRLDDLRRNVVLVPQQAIAFQGTIRSNLAYARPDATDEELWRAAELAQLAETIRAMPAGMDSPVDERGGSLSGGQRQRLALARAILADPAVLLLDDCTSALDAETEARIQDALQEALPGRTRLIVSHKMSSVRSADKILVLDAGRIVESGTHDELMRMAGHYAAQFEAQGARAEAEHA